VLCVASDKRQAEIVFRAARRMVELNDELGDRVQVLPVTYEIRDGGHKVQYVKLQVWTMRCPSLMQGWPTEAGSMQCLALWPHRAPASRCECRHIEASRCKIVSPRAR